MIIGSHVSMSAPQYLLGAVEEAASYGANALMIYTGPPQNTRRKAVSEMKVAEAHQRMKECGIADQSLIIHAPYIINLANCVKAETFELAVSFLKQEIERVKEMQAGILVLHPGSHVQAGEEAGLAKIVVGLDEAMEQIGDINIALETMSGKGSELGYRFDQLRYIMDHAKYGDHLKVCLDTCHVHDAGYDVSEFDALLEEFEQIIGLDRLACLHINDSKNVQGAKKDRHANIGFGEIGFSSLHTIVHHPKLEKVVKILETPYVKDHPPYRYEIAMLKSSEFDENLLERIQEGV